MWDEANDEFEQSPAETVEKIREAIKHLQMAIHECERYLRSLEDQSRERRN